MNEKLISEIEQHGKTARGQKELLKHLSGGKLTFKQAIYAKCYDCCCYHVDGKHDCNMLHCPLYPFMAYNPNRKKQTKKETSLGDNVETRAAMP